MGDQILSRVRTLLDQQLRRRDPTIYGAHDYRDGPEDVLHDFSVDVHFKATGIDTARQLEEFDRMTNYQFAALPSKNARADDRGQPARPIDRGDGVGRAGHGRGDWKWTDSHCPASPPISQ